MSMSKVNELQEVGSIGCSQCGEEHDYGVHLLVDDDGNNYVGVSCQRHQMMLSTYRLHDYENPNDTRAEKYLVN